MPAPSPIADQKARLIEVFETIRRELSYLNTLAATQITILANETDDKVMDTVVINGEAAAHHVAHMLAASALATIIIAEMLAILPPGP